VTVRRFNAAFRPENPASASGLTRIKTPPAELTTMFVLAESASIPANAAGIVTTVVGLAITAAWLAYLYR